MLFRFTVASSFFFLRLCIYYPADTLPSFLLCHSMAGKDKKGSSSFIIIVCSPASIHFFCYFSSLSHSLSVVSLFSRFTVKKEGSTTMINSARLTRCALIAVALALLCSSFASAASCGEGYHTTLFGKCEACKYTSCKTCLLSTSLCTNCVDGYYLTLTSGCKTCPGSNCKTCSSLTGTCTSCPDGYELIKPNLLAILDRWRSGYCRKKFSLPFYNCEDGNHTTILGKCEPCTTPNCKKCYLSSKVCSVCQSGFYMTLKGDCEPCPGENCASCAALTGTCLSCPDGYKYSPPSLGLIGEKSKYGFCEAGATSRAFNCADGYHTTATGECVACEPANCEKCYLSAGACTVCKDGFYLTSNSTCAPCPGANCKTCAAVTGTCLSCPDGFQYTPANVGFMYEASETGFCEPTSASDDYECPDGYHTNLSGDCSACETANCKKCYMSTSSCTICASGYYLTAGGTCERCPGLRCETCADLSGLCTSCPAGLSYVAPNMGLEINSSKYGYCDGASIVQQVMVAAVVVVSFLIGAMAV